MKKELVNLAVSTVIMLGIAVPSFAAVGDKEVDGNIGFNSGSIGSGVGLNLAAGGGVEIMAIPQIKGATLQVRGDIGYNNWNSNDYYGDWSYTRVPISGGARLYIPITAVPNLRAYGEADLEISFFSVSSGNYSSSSSVDVGLPIAAGVEYKITSNVFATAAVKFHIISNDYVSTTVGIGYKF